MISSRAYTFEFLGLSEMEYWHRVIHDWRSGLEGKVEKTQHLAYQVSIRKKIVLSGPFSIKLSCPEGRIRPMGFSYSLHGFKWECAHLYGSELGQCRRVFSEEDIRSDAPDSVVCHSFRSSSQRQISNQLSQ